jgi:hypothetical protein
VPPPPFSLRRLASHFASQLVDTWRTIFLGIAAPRPEARNILLLSFAALLATRRVLPHLFVARRSVPADASILTRYRSVVRMFLAYWSIAYTIYHRTLVPERAKIRFQRTPRNVVRSATVATCDNVSLLRLSAVHKSHFIILACAMQC